MAKVVITILIIAWNVLWTWSMCRASAKREEIWQSAQRREDNERTKKDENKH